MAFEMRNAAVRGLERLEADRAPSASIIAARTTNATELN
jgi:hypothetical protein